MAVTEKGAILQAKQGTGEGILDFVKQALSQDCFDVVLLPARVREGDSFAYFLIGDEALLGGASVLPPIMPVQGARVISSLTRHGKGSKRIAAIMRPCEARATIELVKLAQADLENITLITIDCPGVMPLADYYKDPKEIDGVFEEASRNWDSKPMRPVCRICDNFSATGGEDLHVGTLGTRSGTVLLIPNSSKGEDILSKLGIPLEEDISGWRTAVSELTEGRKKEREKSNDALRSDIEGIDSLISAFSRCIDCHNCMRVCPICYCRQCTFESDKTKFTFEDYIARAKARGRLLIPVDTLLFHIGRMLHMSLSCVSCGMCEDACPMAIPVGQIFTLVGDRNREVFDYVPGRNTDEPLPLRTFEEEELLEVEQSHAGVSAKQEGQDD
ncbi:MAG: 4Fe-4S dicluster domain-containing protein [Dehalococcoidia bacterium]